MSPTFVHTEPKFILLQTSQVPGGGKRKANAKTGRGHDYTCPSRRGGHKLRSGRRQEVREHGGKWAGTGSPLGHFCRWEERISSAKNRTLCKQHERGTMLNAVELAVWV